MCFWRPPHVQSHRSRPHDAGLLQERHEDFDAFGRRGKASKDGGNKGLQEKSERDATSWDLGAQYPW